MGIDRLKTISITENSSVFEMVGFGNTNGRNNGESNLIQNVLRSGDVVFDVGADIGNWSRYILETSKDVSLYAFEPIPMSFKFLEKNMNFENIFLYNIALSQDVGFVNFFVYMGGNGLTDCSSLYYRPVIGQHLLKEIEVETQSLDYFSKKNNISKIDFLKLDVEGAEYFIFLGAQEMLNRKAITQIQFEYGGCNIDSNITLKEIYEFLILKDFSVYRMGVFPNSKWSIDLPNIFLRYFFNPPSFYSKFWI